jgi:RHS repeat-associated protein
MAGISSKALNFGGVENKHLFLGEELQSKEFSDGSGLELYDMNARHYDQQIGRFTGIDILSESFYQWNPYSYSYNNPVRFFDKTGLSADDFVQRKDGTIYWDKNANDQATTKKDETYLGKTLEFKFDSYIDAKLWDGPLWNFPTGNKLTTTVTITASENEAGEYTGASVSMSEPEIGSTPIPPGATGRDYYPGLGKDQNKFIVSCSPSGALSVNMEQHASVNKVEEWGMKQFGYNVVNVAQKLGINITSTGDVKISASTDIFPSATLSVNGTSIMQYNQPSFKTTHSMPVLGHYSVPVNGGVGVTIYDERYKPAVWYKRL